MFTVRYELNYLLRAEIVYIEMKLRYRLESFFSVSRCLHFRERSFHASVSGVRFAVTRRLQPRRRKCFHHTSVTCKILGPASFFWEWCRGYFPVSLGYAVSHPMRVIFDFTLLSQRNRQIWRDLALLPMALFMQQPLTAT